MNDDDSRARDYIHIYGYKYETRTKLRDVFCRRHNVNDTFNREERVYAQRESHLARLYSGYALGEFASACTRVSRTFTRLAGLNTRSGKLARLISLARD